jgi:hypothetical protein
MNKKHILDQLSSIKTHCAGQNNGKFIARDYDKQLVFWILIG